MSGRLLILLLLPACARSPLKYFPDLDLDGFGSATIDAASACDKEAGVYCVKEGDEPEEAGWAPNNTDCDDEDQAVHPDAEEVCNGIDDDCDAGDDCSLVSGDISALADLTVTAETPGDLFGHDLRIMDDIDGDGIDDLVVSAPGSDIVPEDEEETQVGEGSVYYFANAGLSELATTASQASAIFQGTDQETGFTIDVGDVLGGDGVPEIVVGSAGRGAWVVRAGALGTVDLVSVASVTLTSESDCLAGAEETSCPGTYVAIGDYDDGGTDLVIGADTDGTPQYSGRAYLVSDEALDGASSITLDTDPLVTEFWGEGELDRAGVVGRGVNLDRDDDDTDLTIGAWAAGPSNEDRAGAVYLFQDDDRLDGRTEPEVGLATADVKLVGESDGDRLGPTWPVGDLAGDGYSSLAASAAGDDDAGEEAGAIYLLGPDDVQPGVGAVADAAYAKIIAENAGDQLGGFGHPVAAGDLDCDGQQDLVLGTPQFDASTSYGAGAVYVVYGPILGSLQLDAAAVGQVRFTGSLPGGGLGSAMDVGNLDGDGCDDLAVSAPKKGDSGVLSAIYVVLGGAVL